MNVTEHIGTHPQSAGYYVRLLVSTFRTMLAMGMLVAGSGLVGLAAAVFLDGFDLVEVGLGLSIGEVLGTFLVIGVVGAFAFGVATEGRYGAAHVTRAYPSLEVALGRLVGGILVAFLVGWVATRIEPVVADQNLPIRAAHEMVRAVGSSGYLATLIGVPLVWGLRRGLDRAGFDAEIELPVLYVLWAVLAFVAFTMPPV